MSIILTDKELEIVIKVIDDWGCYDPECPIEEVNRLKESLSFWSRTTK